MATNISLTSNVSGVTYTWTCTASSGNITGFSAGTGPIISQFLINTGSGIETVTYSITPHANGCAGNIYNYLVTVYPTPNLLNSPLAKSQCNNLPTNIALVSNIAGTTFSWTCTPSSVNITGFTPGSGLLINQVLINSGFNPETVVYHIVPSANGCNGISTDYTVTVNPVANVILTPPAQSMCSGGTTSFAITSGVAGATFSWTVTPGAGRIAGFSNGSGAMISQTLTLFGFSTDSLTYNVTSSANGCTGSLNHAIARVMPTTPTTFTLCNDPVTTTNAAPITLRGGIPLGGVYSGAGVSGGIFDPAAAGAGNHVITYTYTNSQTCSTSATQTLSVLAATPFTCGTTLTDVRDSKVYSTVLVGGQCWMADNLNYGNAINSTIPQRDNCIIEKYCYAESNINCNTQGGFYQWDEVMHYADIANGQGICPPAGISRMKPNGLRCLTSLVPGQMPLPAENLLLEEHPLSMLSSTDSAT